MMIGSLRESPKNYAIRSVCSLYVYNGACGREGPEGGDPWGSRTNADLTIICQENFFVHFTSVRSVLGRDTCSNFFFLWSPEACLSYFFLGRKDGEWMELNERERRTCVHMLVFHRGNHLYKTAEQDFGSSCIFASLRRSPLSNPLCNTHKRVSYRNQLSIRVRLGPLPERG